MTDKERAIRIRALRDAAQICWDGKYETQNNKSNFECCMQISEDLILKEQDEILKKLDPEGMFCRLSFDLTEWLKDQLGDENGH